MEQPLKQRLIGGAVLVALAVLVLPVFFDGAGVQHAPTLEFSIPERPRIQPAPRIEPAEPTPSERAPEPPASAPQATVEPLVERPPAVDTETAAEPDTTAQEPRTGAAGEPDLRAWVVQLGSFERESNALGLRETLRKAGFNAHILAVSGEQGTAYRVRVGPEQHKQDAERLRQRLAQAGHRGILLRYP